MRFSTLCGFCALALVLVSCKEEDSGAERPEPASTPEQEPKKTVSPAPTVWSELTIHQAIRDKNPDYSGNGQFQIDERGQPVAMSLDSCGVSDISMLRGMPLQSLDLRGCPVPDISALEGMPLLELYVENTAVDDLSPLEGIQTLRKFYGSGTVLSDLSPLEGAPIMELNLVGTRVEDLAPLSTMPIQMLWLTDSPVKDITPLAKCPLVSLTLHRTLVTDLSPLAGTRLQRLHIGETPVVDLTPLQSVPLTRLVFSPGKIEKGMDVVKAIPSLQEIGSQFEDGANDLQSPAAFWSARDGQ